VTDIDEIRALLERQEENYDFGWYHWLHESDPEFVDIGEGLMARTVRTKGGYEGGGEKVEVVVEVSPHIDGIKKFSMESRFFKKLGWYMSHDGVEFDYSGIKEVFPKLKTITVYEEE
jgi:hypothetical protein